MPGSGAGLIRVGNAGGKTIYTTAAPGTSSPSMLEAKGFTKWSFSLDGTFTGTSVTINGTIDLATANGTAQNWFQLSPVSGGGNNPLTTINMQLQYNNPLVAVQAVVTSIATGTVIVMAFAVP